MDNPDRKNGRAAGGTIWMGVSESRGHRLQDALPGWIVLLFLLFSPTPRSRCSTLLRIVPRSREKNVKYPIKTKCVSAGGSTKTQEVDQMLFQCWPSVADVGLTLKRHLITSRRVPTCLLPVLILASRGQPHTDSVSRGLRNLFFREIYMFYHGGD